LREENIFVMDEDRAVHQDIRALKVAILNLMPTKTIKDSRVNIIKEYSIRLPPKCGANKPCIKFPPKIMYASKVPNPEIKEKNETTLLYFLPA